MYRIKVRNKDGDIKMVWENYDKSSKSYKYYEDMSCTKEVDNVEYQEVKDEAPGIPFHMFGIECGQGWYHLIEPIINYIDNYNSKLGDDEPKIAITQIKEKWARLEIYVSYGTDELYEMIDKASDESEMTCEYCGTKDNIGCTQGYFQTLCYDCVKNEVYKRGVGSRQWLSYDTGNLYWVNAHTPDVFISGSSEGRKDLS